MSCNFFSTFFFSNFFFQFQKFSFLRSKIQYSSFLASDFHVLLHSKIIKNIHTCFHLVLLIIILFMLKFVNNYKPLLV